MELFASVEEEGTGAAVFHTFALFVGSNVCSSHEQIAERVSNQMRVIVIIDK